MRLFLIFFSLLGCAWCWGPFSHQIFSCKSLTSPDCKSVYARSYMLGASSPDAFKSWRPDLHSFEFAAQLYHHASNASQTASFDPLAFALGFGSHLAQDYCGHFHGGYLNPAKDHEIEFAADTYAVKNFNSFTGKQGEYDMQLFIPPARTYLLLAVRDILNQTDPQPVNKMLDDFDTLMKANGAAVLLNFLYKQEMVQFDYCQITSFDVAQAHLVLSAGWSVSATHEWIRAIAIDPSPTGKAARAATEGWVREIYADYGGSIC